MSLLSGRRCARVCHAFFLAVVLLAGQRTVVGEVVAGAAAASQDAGDSKVGVVWYVLGTSGFVHGVAEDQEGSIMTRVPPHCRRARIPRESGYSAATL